MERSRGRVFLCFDTWTQKTEDIPISERVIDSSHAHRHLVDVVVDEFSRRPTDASGLVENDMFSCPCTVGALVSYQRMFGCGLFTFVCFENVGRSTGHSSG